MQMLLQDTRQLWDFFFFFRAEHLAALIKPDLINSDKGRKIERAKEGELEKIYNPDTDFTKKKGCGGSGGKLHSTLKGHFTPTTVSRSRQQTTK